jgi:hypothetical protein
MSLSVRDTIFAVSGPTNGSFRFLPAFVTKPIFPALPAGKPVSVRKVAKHYSAAGAELKLLADGHTNLWKYLDRPTLVREIRDRLRDPMAVDQATTDLCGPFAILMELARRAPDRYVRFARKLVETGKFNCPNGDVIKAEAELRDEPGAIKVIGQVNWLLAATMRDDANVWEDVDDDASGLEAYTNWGAMDRWTRGLLDLQKGGWETCYVTNEIGCMKQAQNAIKKGGAAFFFIHSNLIKHVDGDTEEDAHYKWKGHTAGQIPGDFGSVAHSGDDGVTPNHWVVYLSGLNLGSDPQDDDKIRVRVWSWGREYIIICTVDTFTEYLWAVVTGY